jgi:hypothetical protein
LYCVKNVDFLQVCCVVLVVAGLLRVVRLASC